MQRVEHRLSRARSCGLGRIFEVYADLRTACVRAGHALGQKDHEADRWVAATASWLTVPLVAHDKVFKNVDGLDLVTRVDDR